MSRRVALWLIVGLGLFALAGPLARPVAAHATLQSSTPGNDEVVSTAPPEVSLVFDEGVTVQPDSVSVIDPDGKEVSAGSPTQSGGNTRVRQRIDGGRTGTYTVSYRFLSDDGHVIDGSYLFHVGQRTGSAADLPSEGGSDALRVLNAFGRWIALSGALLVGGVLAVVWFVDRRPSDAVGSDAVGSDAVGSDAVGSDALGSDALGSDQRAPDEPEVAEGDGEQAAAGGWRQELPTARFLLLPGAASVLFGAGLSLLASAADLAGGSIASGPGAVGDFVTASWPGSVAGLRVLVALILLLAVAGTWMLRRAPWLAAVCALAAMLLPSVGGHAWTTSPRWVGVSVDAVHVLSAAAWAGGLAVIVLSWDGTRDRVLRFSRMALVAAPLTIATGLLNTWLQSQSISAVTDTAHGRLAMAKLLGALAMVALGSVHRRRLADAARWSAAVLSSYRVEALIGLSVVAVTAVLVGTPPGRDVERGSEPLELVSQAGRVTVSMDVDPGVAGPNDIHLNYKALDGSLASVDAAELVVSTGKIAPRTVTVTPVSANHGVANDVQLTSGDWTFHLTIVVAGEPATTSFEVPVP